jgi:Holliday junction resolvasome RuvABC endonuclease subunit
LRGIKRLKYIKDKLQKILVTYDADILVMEGYSLESKNTPFALGELGGIIKMTCAELDIPFYVAPPNVLKKFVTGYGGASKELIKTHYKLKNSDVADARGLAELGKCILTKEYETRAQLEATKVVLANPENLKVKGGRARPRQKKKYKGQSTII